MKKTADESDLYLYKMIKKHIEENEEMEIFKDKERYLNENRILMRQWLKCK